MNFSKKLLTLWILLSMVAVQLNAQISVIPAKSIRSQKAIKGFSIAHEAAYDFQRDVDDWIHIGTSSVPWGSYNYPIDMYWNTSLTQNLFTADEINHEPCSIEKLVYNYKTWGSYPDVIETEDFRVWLSNTDRTSLGEDADYWMPLSDFTLVYEGRIVLYSGQNKQFVVELDNPFTYNGGNLCIMVEHIYSENVYENHFNFNASYLPEGEVRARLFSSFGGSFDFDLPTNDPNQTGMTLGNIADVSIGISTSSDGSLSGTVTNVDNAAIEGALVSIVGTDLKAYTNTTGYYEFPFVQTGTHSVKYSAFGYVTDVVELEINDALVHDVTMQYLPKGTVLGSVFDKDNNPIAGANINISGYAAFSGQTDATGTFSIPEVYYAENYSVVVSKHGYHNVVTTLTVETETTTMNTFELSDVLENPSKVDAVKDDSKVDITWLSPLERTVYRRDGGQQEIQLAHNYMEDLAVFGQVFNEPAQLYQMSWYTTETDVTHDYVNVYVFDLDNNGMPTNSILFEKAYVPSVDDQWSTFRFPEVINAENGFMIAISYHGRVEIGIDAGQNPDYPFMEGVNWVSEDYTSGQFMPLENLGLGPIPGNFMIRAEGYYTGDKNEPKSLNTYKVYRLKDGQEENDTAWTLLGDNLTAKTYTDNTLNAQESGWYRYAVTAIYSGNDESPAGFSNRVENGLTTKVTLNVTTNISPNESMGAHVELYSSSVGETYTGTIDNNGSLFIDNVFKGTYRLQITKEGFNDIVVPSLDLTSQEAYTLSYELIEALDMPFNLEVFIQEDKSALFKWNHTATIFEDFESCTNFDINPSGVVDWIYHDVDGKKTIGIDNFEYANKNEPHAFFVFNPSATTPPVDLELNPTIAPYSGQKFLASFAPKMGNNDDYIISPKLNFGEDFTFRFMAKSFDSSPALNKIMVGYSTDGFEPEDFTWVTQQAVSVPNSKWTQYEYTMNQEVQYVAIRNVSDGGYILMIDDVELFAGTSTKGRALIKYEVYMNGTLMGETTERTYTFKETDMIFEETNIAGVKAIYTTGSSEMATMQFYYGTNVGIESNISASMQVYPNPSNGNFNVKLDGQYEVSVINLAGVVIHRSMVTNEAVISLEGISAGIYIVKAQSENRILHQTIIVK